MTVSGFSQRRARILFAVLTAQLALLHLLQNALHLVDRELWLDEASTYGVAAHSLVRNFTLPIEFHSQPPLYYLILHALLHISSAEWFIRGFSWLLVLALIILVLWYVDELTPTARLFMAFALIYCNFTTYLSQELRPYALSALTSFWATLELLRAVDDPSARRARRYAVAAIVMLYSLAFDVWIFAAQGLYLAGIVIFRALRGGRLALRALMPLLVAVAAAAFAYLPYLNATTRLNGAIGHPSLTGSLHEIVKLHYYVEALRGFCPIGYPYSFALLGLVLLAIRADILARRAHFVLWLLILVGQVAFVHGFLLGRSSFNTRYLAPAYPALFMLMALGLDQALRSERPFWQAAPMVLLLLAWDAAPTFSSSAKAAVPDSRWRVVHRALAAVHGRKVIFFDTGYEGQMLEYVARNDRDLGFALQKGRRWASGGDNHLDPEYITATIKSEAPQTRCFYYVVDRGDASPYFSVFIPAMQRLGYVAAGSPADSINGYCRP